MKKTLLCLLTLALLLTIGLLAASAEEGEKNVTCYVGGTVTVDGEIEEIWEQVEPIYVENLKTGAYMNDPNKTFEDYARLQCKVLWDGEYTLYILYQVTDPVLCLDGPEEWDRDSVEFFIDEDNERAGAFDSNSTQWRTLAVEGLLEYPHQRVPLQAVKYTADGYIVELAYEFMALDPVDGHVIGFDLQVNDDAEGTGQRHACLGWSDTDDSASTNNTVWGTLTFSTQRVQGAQTEAPTEEATEPETLLADEHVYDYWNEDIIKDCFIAPNQTTVEATEEGAKLMGVDPGEGAVDPFVTINLKKYITTVGVDPVSCKNYGFVVLKIKAEGTTGDCELFYTRSPAAGLSEMGYYEPDGTWQYLVFDLSFYDEWARERNPTSMRLDWATGYEGDATAAYMTVGAIAFFQTEDEVYAYTGEAKPEETEAPTKPETQPAPETEAPTEAPTETPTQESKGGCGSTVAFSALILSVVAALGFALKKKED